MRQAAQPLLLTYPPPSLSYKPAESAVPSPQSLCVCASRYSISLLCWYKGTNTDAKGAARMGLEVVASPCGYNCTNTAASAEREVCRTVCGDGKLAGNETCDDGNTLHGDGCSANCLTLEKGWVCSAVACAKSLCNRTSANGTFFYGTTRRIIGTNGANNTVTSSLRRSTIPTISLQSLVELKAVSCLCTTPRLSTYSEGVSGSRCLGCCLPICSGEHDFFLGCPAGKYFQLVATEWKIETSCMPCLHNSWSPMYSTRKSNCTCNAGYTGEDGEICHACPAGTYKTLSDNVACAQCPAGKYSNMTARVNDACEACPMNKHSPNGSTSILACV
jgi:cysteine-rich repeat protein